MKLLETAGLVVIRRRGRERWNHINAVPLELMYERSVKLYQALTSRLTNLKSRIEGETMLSEAEGCMKTGATARASYGFKCSP